MNRKVIRQSPQPTVSYFDEGVFGDVSRQVDEGRGIEGIVATVDGYFDPVSELMRGAPSRA